MNPVDFQIKQLKGQLYDGKHYFKFGEEECYFHIRSISEKRREKEQWPEFLVPAEICINNTPFGVIESVDNNHLNKSLPQKIEAMRSWLNQSSYRYYLVGDLSNQDKHFHAIDKYAEKHYVNYFFASLIKKLAEDFEKYRTIERQDAIKAAISERLEKIEVKDALIESSLQKALQSVVYDPMRNKFTFCHIQLENRREKFPHAEFQLMGHVLKCNKIRKLSRYGTLDTAMKVLQNNSVEMNCIFGMNDSSELSYAHRVFKQTDPFEGSPETHLNKIHSINKKFILCCSFTGDDLNLWRLYGDDGKGVSITFDLGTSYFDEYHQYFLKGFFVGYVSYAEANGTHPVLDAIGSYYKGCEDLGECFYMEHEDVWKHFFKPAEYAVENEIRVFFHNKGELRKVDKNDPLSGMERVYKPIKWRVGSNGIVNPYVTYDLTEIKLPLKIKNITLGPAMPHQELNFLQLRTFIKGINDKKRFDETPIAIGRSIIQHYRPK